MGVQGALQGGGRSWKLQDSDPCRIHAGLGLLPECGLLWPHQPVSVPSYRHPRCPG